MGRLVYFDCQRLFICQPATDTNTTDFPHYTKKNSFGLELGIDFRRLTQLCTDLLIENSTLKHLCCI